MLLKHGAIVNAVDEDKNQPLHLACRRGHTENGIVLLSHRADVSTKDRGGQLPLQLISQFVLRSSRGIHKDGNSALHIAARWGRAGTIKLLLGCGATTNVINKHGQTPLHTVADREDDYPELCEILLERDAKVDAVDNDGNQPFDLACRRSNVETCELLLSRGTDVEVMNSSDRMPFNKLLMVVAGMNELKRCRWLLEKGANPNFKELDGMQPLSVATRNRDLEMCRLLLEYGAKISTDSKQKDKGALQYAIVNEMADITQLLLSHLSSIQDFRIGRKTAVERSQRVGTRLMATLLHAADSYPEEILSQGEAAVQVYLSSCNEGTAVTVFLRVDVVGRDGAGKTSLTKSLTLQLFNANEPSTKGIVIDPKCQIIVREACDWTNALTIQDYRNMYYKNVSTIMADTLDNPQIRDEYLVSKAESRPMKVKKECLRLAPVDCFDHGVIRERLFAEEETAMGSIPKPLVDDLEIGTPSCTTSGELTSVGNRQDLKKELVTAKADRVVACSLVPLETLMPLTNSPRTSTPETLLKSPCTMSRREEYSVSSSGAVEPLHSISSALPISVTTLHEEQSEIPETSASILSSVRMDSSEDTVSTIQKDALISKLESLDSLSQSDLTPATGSARNPLALDKGGTTTIAAALIPDTVKDKVSWFLRNRDSRDGAKQELVVTVLDYAGQSVFYATHQICLAKDSFYYVVFDASKALDAITPSTYRLEGHIICIDQFGNQTNYDRVEEWISAIHIMEPAVSRRIMIFEEEGIASPAVFLVGTHADEAEKQPGLLDKQDEFLRNKLKHSVLARHIVWASPKQRMCFYVDNTLTNPSSGKVDPQVSLLREKTEQIARNVRQRHKLPITWLKFEEEVRALKQKNKAKKTASVDEMLQIAVKGAGIKNKKELMVLLRYLSNRVVLLYHPVALKSRDDEVVLDVEWLISRLEKVITIQTDVPPNFTNDVALGSEKGIMTVELIQFLLKDSGSAERLIISLMGRFDLLCPYTVFDAAKPKEADDATVFLSVEEREALTDDPTEELSAYFIPCLLLRESPLESEQTPAVCKTMALLLSSAPIRVPPPLFYRLLTCLCRRFGCLPVLFQNVGYFIVYPHHKLEISLNRYSLQMTVLATAHNAPSSAVCVRVRQLIVKLLDELKKQDMPGLQLQLGYNELASDSRTVEGDFVSLDGFVPSRSLLFATKSKRPVLPPSELSQWYPQPNEKDASTTLPPLDSHNVLPGLNLSLPVAELLSSPPHQCISSPPHQCIVEISNLLDADDPLALGDDWRKLWSELTDRRALEEDVARNHLEGPTVFTLRTWCRMKPTQTTIGSLIQALNAIYRNDVAQKMQRFVCEKSPLQQVSEATAGTPDGAPSVHSSDNASKVFSPSQTACSSDVTQIAANGTVTLAQLNAVAEVARSNWLEVGLSLGFQMEKLDEYEEREPRSLHRRLLRLLVDWKKNETHSTVQALVTACNEAGVGGAVERELGVD